MSATAAAEPAGRAPATGTGLLTDRYELTMLDAMIADGTAANDGVFECFTRRLPAGRRFGVAGGLGRLVPLLSAFRFDDVEVDWLEQVGVVSPPTAEYLRGYRFDGDVDGYPEGEVYGPGAPLLTVRAPLAQALVLETLVLSVLNFDSAITAAAARMRLAAGDRSLIEMGGRRTHEQAAVAAARAAYVGGFDSTSNLMAGRRYGIPTVGTSAHAFTLAHADERAAFDSQLRAQGLGTTLLVDTYDTVAGIELAVQVAREHGASGPGAIRIDSGALADEAAAARRQLDDLGATDTRIVVTSDLDEHAIAGLAGCPVDGYGVGTQLVVGSGSPTAGLVYKLVAVSDAPGGPLRPVEKSSAGKHSDGGRKTAYRVFGADGTAQADLLVVDDELPVPDGAVPLQVPVLRAGQVVHHASVHDARAHRRQSVDRLPAAGRELSDGDPALAGRGTGRDYQA